MAMTQEQLAAAMSAQVEGLAQDLGAAALRAVGQMFSIIGQAILERAAAAELPEADRALRHIEEAVASVEARDRAGHGRPLPEPPPGYEPDIYIPGADGRPLSGEALRRHVFGSSAADDERAPEVDGRAERP